MSEPVMWRTQVGNTAGQARTPMRRVLSPMAKALSLCGALSVMMLIGLPVQVHAETASSEVQSVESAKAQHSLLVDIANLGKRLVAVGDRGHILYSDDNGNSWSQAKVPTRQLLTAVYFVDDTYGWAVGHDAQILASTDGGATWVKQYEDLELEAPLLDVWFKDRNTGFAVGAYGALMSTTDGGSNWENVSDLLNNEDAYHLNAIAEIGSQGLFVVGEQGVMFRSADYGQTWENVESPYEGSLFGVLGAGEPGALVAYGLRGHLFRSADFGSTWQRISLQREDNGTLEFGLSNGSLLADGSIVIVGHGGSVLRSTDKGRSFTVQNRPDRLSLAGVAADGKGRLIFVGQGGVQFSAPTETSRGQQ